MTAAFGKQTDSGELECRWDQVAKGGWDAFQAARQAFLLGVAIDTAPLGLDRRYDASQTLDQHAAASEASTGVLSV